MYFVDFFRRLFDSKNTGLLIYLILNVALVASIFFSLGPYGLALGVVVYALSLAIALSPVGEVLMRFLCRCKSIKNNRVLINRLEPLFHEVYSRAVNVDPGLQDGIELYVSDEEFPNAFATGRKTICLTLGILGQDDETLKAILAHEMGHISHKDTDLSLAVGIGNLFVLATYTVSYVFGWIMARLMSLFESLRFVSWLFDLSNSILGFLYLGWTKMGTMLVMSSSRKCEFGADEFSYNCGYGLALRNFFDDGTIVVKSKGVWSVLSDSHPQNALRVERLDELLSGVHAELPQANPELSFDKRRKISGFVAHQNPKDIATSDTPETQLPPKVTRQKSAEPQDKPCRQAPSMALENKKLFTCPGCQKNVSRRARLCPHCGMTLDGIRFCPQCDTPSLDPENLFCEVCGFQLDASAIQCEVCGAFAPAGASHCLDCGDPFQNLENVFAGRS